jgi:hypothetical protein
MPRRPLALFAVAIAIAIATLASSCDYVEDDPPRPTNTYAPTSTVAPTSESGVREFGEDPVFYRTLDEFKTLRANEPYFVLLRITGGYDQPTLRVRAEKVDGTSDPVAYDVVSGTPLGPDAEGAYFPLSITLPSPGEWTLYVDTGDEEVPLEVTVQPPL